MAALALTGNGSISTAESTTSWVGDTFSLEPDIKVEGSNSVACAQTVNGNNDLAFQGSFSLNGSHLRMYWNISYVGNLATTNPIQVSLTDGTNTDYFTYFASNTDYSGGWRDLVVVVDATNFPNVYNQTITEVGIRVATASKPRNVPANCWVDNWRYSDGVEIYSTTTEAVSFSAAAAVDATNVYNIITELDGVVFASGEVFLGQTGTTNANIVSSNETLVFADRNVATTLYALTTQEGTGNTDIDIDGLVCKTVNSAQGAEITFNSSLNTLSVTNSSFVNAGAITVTPTVTSPVFTGNGFTDCGATSLNISVNSCDWTRCGTVTVTGTPTLTNCSFVDSTAAASVTVSDLARIGAGCSFESDGSNYAVELSSIGSGSMVWKGTLTGYESGGTGGSPVTGTTTGNEAIYVNVGSGTLTITVDAGATTPSIRTAGATVNVVVGQTTVTFADLKANSEVRVYTRDGSGNNDTELDGVENSGTTFAYSATAATALNYVIFHLDYLPIYVNNFTHPSSNQTVNVQQAIDRNRLV